VQLPVGNVVQLCCEFDDEQVGSFTLGEQLCRLPDSPDMPPVVACGIVGHL